MHSAANNPTSGLETFQHLTVQGASATKLDKANNSVLMLYLLVNQTPSVPVIKFLEKAGSPLSGVNTYGWTVLHFAFANPNTPTDVLQFLIGRGLDINA